MVLVVMVLVTAPVMGLVMDLVTGRVMDLATVPAVAAAAVTVRMTKAKAKNRKGQPHPPVIVKGLHPVTATFFCAPSLISPGATGARCLLSRPPPT